MYLTFLFMAVNFEFVATQRNLRKGETLRERMRESEKERVRERATKQECGVKEKLKWVEILFIFR